MCKRFSRSIVIALSLICFGLVAGQPGPAKADDRPDLVVAVNKLPRSLEPALKTGNVDVRVTYSVFDTLIRRDFLNEKRGAGAKLIPHIATSWKRIDNSTLVVNLRKGVKFHNGDELTSEDVAFTFSPQRMTSKKGVIKNGRRYFGHIKSVTPVDKYTVRFVSKKPDLILEQRLASYTSWIVNKRSWMEAGAKARKAGKKDWMKAALKKMGRNPVGTGPFKFVEWKNGDYQKFTAFDAYFGGKPAFKSVTFKQVPEVSTRIAGLVSGEFDIAVNIPPDNIRIIERYKGKLSHKSVVLNNSHVLIFNTKHPVLKNKKIRQALALAIDRPALINALWGSKTYTPNGHQLAEFGPMYNKDRKPISYDPEKAKALLKEAGYKGEPLLYKTMATYYVNALSAAQIIQQMWKKIGVNARIEVVENFKQKRSKDVAVYPWSNTYRLPDPTGAMWILYGDKSALQRKYKYWKAPKEFNELGNKVLTSADMKKRFSMFQRQLDILEDEAPMTILYNPFETYAMRKGVEWTPYPLYFMDLRPDNLQIKPRAKRMGGAMAAPK